MGVLYMNIGMDRNEMQINTKNMKFDYLCAPDYYPAQTNIPS